MYAGGKAGLPGQRPEAAEQREKKEEKREQPGGDQAGSKLEGEAGIALWEEPHNELGWDGCSWVPPASTVSAAWFYAKETPLVTTSLGLFLISPSVPQKRCHIVTWLLTTILISSLSRLLIFSPLLLKGWEGGLGTQV